MRIALAIAAIAFLAGCSSTETTATSTPPAVQPSVALSPRGNVVKKLGEAAVWPLADGSGELSFVVTNLTAMAACPGGDKPEHGSNLIFDLRVTTPASWPTGSNLFHRNGYSVVGPDGVTVRDVWEGNTVSCADYDSQWADDLAPGSAYQGKVVLDVPPGSKILAFNPAAVKSRGFEWALPGS